MTRNKLRIAGWIALATVYAVVISIVTYGVFLAVVDIQTTGVCPI